MSSVGGSSGSTERTAAPLSSSVLGIAIVAITGMQLMSTLDGTIVIVALPRMQADLDLSDVGQELGHHRLRADVRRPAAARRPRRRRDRPQARVSVRRRGVHDRLAGVRSGHRRDHADRRPSGAGHRRRGRRADRLGADRDDLCRRARAQSRDGGLGRHAGHRLGDGSGARRRADRRSRGGWRF